MKKLMSLLLAVVLVLGLTACGDTGGEDPVVIPEIPESAVYAAEIGMGIDLPERYQDVLNVQVIASGSGAFTRENVNFIGEIMLIYQSSEVYNRLIELGELDEQLTDEEYEELVLQTRTLCSLVGIEKETLGDYLEAEGSLQDLTGFLYNDLVATLGDNVYYFCSNDLDDEGLTETAAIEYQLLMAELPTLRDNVICHPVVNDADTSPTASGQRFGAGTDLSRVDTVDFDGETFDGASFGEAEYTLVNIWGTYCTPCISEMPDLEKIRADYADKGLQVVGVCIDVERLGGNMTTALAIVEQTGVQYRNVYVDSVLNTDVLRYVNYVPTTFLVDREGKVVGDIAVGAKDYAFFQEMVEAYLGQ